ncbi:hypothetical protein [Nonomuraea diastatica]|uniref:Uncharacterized protein n=1 Tax=Nonomuraea diastatica TaxID=1848329 RepID=A0A4R4W6H1_9ACTN|nr:hypothetical protein [Nonomuraea diastatica]TDD11643.1 hypothetical protein E1294_44825 [Nonomuraea diastatica]
MRGEIAKAMPMPVALRRSHDESSGRLEIMALMYDLDGALKAGQLGLARYTAGSLIDASVAVWLRERCTALPAFEHATARARVALSVLRAVNPDLASRVSALYCAALPLDVDAVTSHCQAVLDLVGDLTGHGSDGLASAVRAWAESARATRDLCERLGVPVGDFYWAPPDAETWHSDVLKHAAMEASS